LENTEGYQLVAIDPMAEIRGAGQTPMTLSDIRPGDRVDYEVATWAGMSISDFAYVTPAGRAEGSDLITAAKASEEPHNVGAAAGSGTLPAAATRPGSCDRGSHLPAHRQR